MRPENVTPHSQFPKVVPASLDGVNGTMQVPNGIQSELTQIAQTVEQTWVAQQTNRAAALDMAEVDREGLDKQDRRYLETLVGVFDGGPTGVEALAATMNIAPDTLSDEVEPYLLREQFIVRSPRGRIATMKGYQTLGRPPKKPVEIEPQRGLFDEM